VITLPILNAQFIFIPFATKLADAIAKCCANSAFTISIDGTAIIMLGGCVLFTGAAGCAVATGGGGARTFLVGIFNLPFFIIILIYYFSIFIFIF
jgi:choline-glycine betaine transporter